MDVNNNVMTVTESNTVTSLCMPLTFHELYSEKQLIENQTSDCQYILFVSLCLSLNVQGKYKFNQVSTCISDLTD